MAMLRDKVIRGSSYLAMREGLGVAVSLVGMLLMTRLIGPANYGVYSAGFVVLVYMISLSELGVGMYLVRARDDEGLEIFDQAFTLLIIQSLLFVCVVLLAVPLLEQLIRLPRVGEVITALLLGLPLVHLAKVPMARLEQQLDYRRVAGIELAGQIAFYGVALPCAYAGAGFWSPVAGWWSQSATHLVLAYRTEYRPKLLWQPVLIRRMLRFGVSYSVSLWITLLREFANPVVVGRFLGAAAVGQVALAIRIIESLGFVRVATTRISLAALAKLDGSRERLGRALTEGMVLQVLAVGPFLVAFALIGPFVVPRVFGAQWLPLFDVYPLLAAGYAIGSVFMLHNSTLAVLHRTGAIALTSLVNFLLLIAAALLLVPRLGTVGFGLAELAVIPAYVLLHIFVLSAGIIPRYTHALLWVGATVIPLLMGPYVRYGWILLLAPLLWKPARQEARTFLRIALSRLAPARDVVHLPAETPAR